MKYKLIECANIPTENERKIFNHLNQNLRVCEKKLHSGRHIVLTVLNHRLFPQISFHYDGKRVCIFTMPV